MMDKCLFDKDFQLLLSESASKIMTVRHRQHLRICDTCATRLAELRIDTKDRPGTINSPITRPMSNMSLRHALEPNVQIGDFRIERRLGVGGMAVVYQAYQVSLKRYVALKVLGSSLLNNESAVQRFHRETRAAAKLQNPNIVSIYEEGVHEGICYYAMELVQGKSLSELIAEIAEQKTKQNDLCSTKTKLTEIFETRFGSHATLNVSYGSRGHFSNIASIISEAADALDYAHQNGVIHRDIKPSNLMLSNNGRLMVTDFGIARVVDDNAMTVTGSFLGTPLYMSPEQISESCDIDHRTDIYSLGATLYELLTLQPLFKGLKTHEQAITHILNKTPIKPRAIDDKIPVDLETICCKAIDPAPDRRYQSAGEFADDLRRFTAGMVIKAKPAGPLDKCFKFVNRHKIASALVCSLFSVAIIAGCLAWSHLQDSRVQKTIPRITQLIEQKKFYDAFVLAKEVENIQPSSPILKELWPKIARFHTIETEPSQADLYIKDYNNNDSAWINLGKSSTSRDIRVPYGANTWKIKKNGYTPLLVAKYNSFDPRFLSQPSKNFRLIFTLHESGKYPRDMSWVPPIESLKWDVFHNSVDVGDVPAYLIDKFEVTNKQFKEFVDQGGYSNVKYWDQAFIKDGKVLSWNEAISHFVDSTGQQGPSTWSNGTYPEDRDAYPVSGVSWYEAAAYAKFSGKALPTVFHWLWSSTAWSDNYQIVQKSNFDGSIAPVGKYTGMGRQGLYDCAGNVREWCYNAVDNKNGQRCLFGGAFSDAPYMFKDNLCAPPWDRDVRNGFRCAKYIGGKGKVPQKAFDYIVRNYRDMNKFVPLTAQQVQNNIETFFQYEKTPLNSVLESTDQQDSYTLEKVSFNAAYSERITAMLYIPNNVKPPYQTVIWFPGSDKIRTPWNGDVRKEMKLIFDNGRVLVVPFYKGTYDRMIKNTGIYGDTIAARNLYVQRILDFRRTIDFIESRKDLNSDNIAYVGFSWGGSLGPFMMAVEERIKTGIYLLGGISGYKKHPVYDAANYLPFVKSPVLMINGSSDTTYTDANRIYFFDKLGTPEKHKKQVIFSGGHSISWRFHDEYNKIITDWLDTYQGPVNPIANEPQQ